MPDRVQLLTPMAYIPSLDNPEEDDIINSNHLNQIKVLPRAFANHRTRQDPSKIFQGNIRIHNNPENPSHAEVNIDRRIKSMF